MGAEVLDELRAISATSKRITPTQQRLALAATAEVAASVVELQSTMDHQFERIMQAIEAQNANIEIIKDQLEGVERRISTCDHCVNKSLVDRIQRNPAYILGAWVRDHPKSAGSLGFGIGVALLVLLTLWLDPGVRRLTFEFLQVFPPGAIEALTR